MMAKQAGQILGNNGRIPTLILVIFFALLSMAGCLLTFLVTLTSTASPETGTFYELVPMFAGLMVAGLGGAVMTILRRRFRIGWLALLGLLIIWFGGVGLLFFGGSAVFFYDEPAEFMPNFGFAMAMCIVPGGLLALAALAFYGYSAWRSRRSLVNEAGLIQSLKEQEKFSQEDD